MKGGRFFAVLLLSLGLVACDSGRESSPSPQPPSVEVSQPRAAAVQPEVAPAQPPAPQPATPREVERRPQAHRAPAPQGGAQHKSVDRPAAVVKPVGPLPLDLRPPGDGAKDVAGPSRGDAPLGEPQALLPPLFAPEDKATSGNVELAGRLITNPRSTAGKDYWDSVEGAEVQVQFRR